MKKIRIGCGAGCSFDRLEPAIELVEKGDIDYIVFECLAERTIANNQQQKLKDPSKGYTPMLEPRMRGILKQAKENEVKIVTNMGAANPSAAVDIILKVAKELNITNIKVAMVSGDDLTHNLEKYKSMVMWQSTKTLGELDAEIISANVYLGAEAIKEALDNGADIVITGRVADVALFVGPMMHEFGWTENDLHKIGQATLLGHLLECGGQVTGGYFADPGYKDVENLHILGHPIAEIDETGDFIVTKVKGSGGEVSPRTCKEQLLYEITDPACYITPNAMVDFTNVNFKQVEKDVVLVTGAVSKGVPDTYKVNIGYCDCYIGEGEVSFGGLNSLSRAKLCADIIEKRLEIVKANIDEYRVDYIGYNSLYKTNISDRFAPEEHSEIRLRISGRTKTYEDAMLISQELDYLYTNGPAGSSGVESRVRQVLSIGAMIIPKEDIATDITYWEV
ncbi:acyclic terpene utilization AtuA family protein [Tissierella sp. MB52-C2]|uniref:acyclic terpene utilization AtuA family protein n=1 Tax=Tissierella sp. MB52-C2 TaxID=3070999 RepID=UPI00280C35A2|nr:acyclic terpene utilization AtuA family protein [Tissierella sp. MB52-C2]WMM25369.1 acyclic terpene utilization AtuA family protein [Tissierella sp. MB52-C2]